MTAAGGARERVRAELTREIAQVARRQLAVEGAAGLSLRAVARELGMASSAIYRYFPSRDELLTTLIVDGYNAIGEAAERSEAKSAPDDYPGRWFALAHAARDWALAHPHEYALLYGSPVPGYQAPHDTLAPAVRATAVYGRLVTGACRAGTLTTRSAVAPSAPLAEDAARIRAAVMPEVPDDVLLRALSVWTGLFGWLNFELFGQFEGTVLARRAAFDHHLGCLAQLLGLPSGDPR